MTADLRDRDWPARLPPGPYDAVLTATALHWLPAEDLARIYRDVAVLLRPGGVFLNADHTPEPGTPLLNAADESFQRRRQQRERARGVLDWAQWWAAVAADPVLAKQAAARALVHGSHEDPQPRPADWHRARLVEAGFREAGVIWRSVGDSLVAAVR